MIFQVIIGFGTAFVSFLLLLLSNLLTNIPQVPNGFLGGFKYFLGIANSLLPDGYLFVFLSSVGFWTFASFSWAIIEFIYKKIPFINIR